jgi:hypothetical protein
LPHCLEFREFAHRLLPRSLRKLDSSFGDGKVNL